MLWTQKKLTALAIFAIAVLMARHMPTFLEAITSADFPNPDSYYKLVLLQDHSTSHGFHFIARDNAPDGNWIHWSIPHSWTMWQLHRLIALAGVEPSAALIWSGSLLTLISFVLVTIFITLAVARTGTARAALASIIALCASLPIMGYARLDQLTHHIFMLAPVAAAAMWLLPASSARAGLLGGAALGLALWISPETMPLVAGFAGLHALRKLEDRARASLWPAAMGLLGVVTFAWLIDPPPPTFSAWALDHISLAWLLYAALIAALLGSAQIISQQRWTQTQSISALALTAAIAAVLWIVTVPNALAGYNGLLPEELHRLWFSQISELKAATTAPKIVGYVAVPIFASTLTLYMACRARSFWLLALALLTFIYACFGVLYARMGAASGMLGALTLGIAAVHWPGFADRLTEQGKTNRQQLFALGIMLAPILQLGLVAGLVLLTNNNDDNLKKSCSLSPIADALNAMAPTTMAVPVFSTPEFLYRTHHRSIAGPYHHNVQGLLDNYHIWIDTSTNAARARAIMMQRGVTHILVCTAYQKNLKGSAEVPSLVERLTNNQAPIWLKEVRLPNGEGDQWRLYVVNY